MFGLENSLKWLPCPRVVKSHHMSSETLIYRTCFKLLYSVSGFVIHRIPIIFPFLFYFCFPALFFSYQGWVSMTTKWNVMLNFTFPVSPHMAFLSHSNMDGTTAIQMLDFTQLAAGSWPWEGGPLSFGSSWWMPQMVDATTALRWNQWSHRVRLSGKLRDRKICPVTNLSCSCIKKVAREKQIDKSGDRFKLKELRRVNSSNFKRLFIWDSKK